jgi:hypothetical protein
MCICIILPDGNIIACDKCITEVTESRAAMARMTTQNLHQRLRTQANMFDVERKFTGEINQAGEPTYYYERSFAFPCGKKQTLLEDRELHSASRPFCVDAFCPCHYEDHEMIRFLVRLIGDGVITNDEAKAIFNGKRPLDEAEAAFYQQSGRRGA